MELRRANWTEVDYREFQNFLFSLAEEGYRDFVASGIITERPILGVRVPKCREIAAEIYRGGPVAVKDFLGFSPVALEEVAVRGFVIAKMSYQEMTTELPGFIALIDNWEICDTFCVAIGKSVRKNREAFLDEIDKMLWSLDEFQTRVGLVCLLDHYVVADYLPVIFDRISELAKYLSDDPGLLSVERSKNSMVGERMREVMAWDAYYVKMAVAWLIATCFSKFPEETLAFFSNLSLPRWTHNRAIAKTCESLRVDRDLKAKLRKIKR